MQVCCSHSPVIPISPGDRIFVDDRGLNDRVMSTNQTHSALAIPRTPAASPLVAPALLARLLSLTSIADTFMCVVTPASDIIYLHALSH